MTTHAAALRPAASAPPRAGLDVRDLLVTLTSMYCADLAPEDVAIAVREVVELHEPVVGVGGKDAGMVMRCAEDRRRWPCPTMLPLLATAARMNLTNLRTARKALDVTALWADVQDRAVAGVPR